MTIKALYSKFSGVDICRNPLLPSADWSIIIPENLRQRWTTSIKEKNKNSDMYLINMEKRQMKFQNRFINLFFPYSSHL